MPLWFLSFFSPFHNKYQPWGSQFRPGLSKVRGLFSPHCDSFMFIIKLFLDPCQYLECPGLVADKWSIPGRILDWERKEATCCYICRLKSQHQTLSSVRPFCIHCIILKSFLALCYRPSETLPLPAICPGRKAASATGHLKGSFFMTVAWQGPYQPRHSGTLIVMSTERERAQLLLNVLTESQSVLPKREGWKRMPIT